MTGATLADPRPEGYLHGVLLVGAAGLVWSLGGLFFRMVEEAGIWQVVAWRTGFLCVSMLIVVFWRYRGDAFAAFTRMGRWGIVGALGIGAANTLFMFSLQHTYVANTLLMLSASPILSAIIAWFFLRERVRRATLVAMFAVAVGVAVMVSGGLGTDRWLGDVLALVTVTAFAFVVIAVRAGRNVDMMPCVALGGFIACCFSVFMVTMQGESLAVSTNDLFWCAMMGVVQITGGMVLFIIGSKKLPAAELALLSLTEVICGPIWVWLVIGELPVQATFWGGAIVLAAMVGNALSGMRRRHPLPQV